MVRQSACRLRQGLAMLAMATTAAWPMSALAGPGRSIGVVSAMGVRANMAPTDVPISGIAGKAFIFLEKPACEQGVGYPAFRLVSQTESTDGPGTDPLAGVPRYADFVGKVIQADSVDPLTCPRGEYNVTFTVPESGVRLVAKTFTQAIADVAPVEELTWARQRWLGKKIYPRQRTIQTYDSASGRYGELDVKLTEPLQVVDVIWGLNATKPLWIVVERDNGERGFFATAYSWTNLYGDGWSAQRPWEDKIAESNLVYELRQFGTPGATRREFSLADPPRHRLI